MVTVEVDLDVEINRKVTQAAKKNGVTEKEYILEILKKEVNVQSVL